MKAEVELFGAGPVFPVPDVQAAVDYYQNTLGFALDFVQDPPEHGAVTRGRVGIQFTHVPDIERSDRHSGWTYIFVSNIDALYEEFQGNGAAVTVGLENHDHGMREFELEDLNGYRIRFGQYI